jgi:hypothetical protein
VKSTYAKRIAQLRRHRDLYLKKARWAKERQAALSADRFASRAEIFECRLNVVRNVTRARCNNHRILMWERIARGGKS